VLVFSHVLMSVQSVQLEHFLRTFIIIKCKLLWRPLPSYWANLKREAKPQYPECGRRLRGRLGEAVAAACDGVASSEERSTDKLAYTAALCCLSIWIIGSCMPDLLVAVPSFAVFAACLVTTSSESASKSESSMCSAPCVASRRTPETRPGRGHWCRSVESQSMEPAEGESEEEHFIQTVSTLPAYNSLLSCSLLAYIELLSCTLRQTLHTSRKHARACRIILESPHLMHHLVVDQAKQPPAYEVCFLDLS
jgi:hypothetical protein